MRCEDCLAIIEDLIDGEAGERAALSVRAHLEMCTDCAFAYEDLVSERELLMNIALGVEPPKDSWTAIKRRIEEERIAPSQYLFARLQQLLRSTLMVRHSSPALLYVPLLLLIVCGLTAFYLNLNGELSPSIENNLVSSNAAGDIRSTTLASSGSEPESIDPPLLSPSDQNREQIVNNRRAHRKNKFPRRYPTATPTLARRTYASPHYSSESEVTLDGEKAKEQILLALQVASTKLHRAQQMARGSAPQNKDNYR